MANRNSEKTPILNVEIIYRLLQNSDFARIIKIMSEQRQKLTEDPGLQNAVFVFVDELFREIKSKDITSELHYILETLYIIHVQSYFRLKDEQAIHLISLLERRVAKYDLYEGAKDYPNDPLCRQIIEEYQQNTYSQNVATANVPQNFNRIPGLKYESEIRCIENVSPYLKIYLRSDFSFEIITDHIRKLPSVKRANITERNGKRDLTIYNQRPYTIEETKAEVELTLDNYFSRNENDPIFKTEIFSEISDVAYFQILDYILQIGKSLEGPRRISEKWDEEQYRDFFVLYLDSLSKKHTATGETFHGIGKTDILFRSQEKENLLIAECKIWGGSAHLGNALNQLFSRYLNWRDTKAAMIIFNTKVNGFVKLVDSAITEMQKNPLHLRYLGKRTEGSFSFLFKSLSDPDQVIKLELLIFNFV